MIPVSEGKTIILQIRDWQTFSVKSSIVNSVGFVGHMVSIGTTQLCFCRVKAVIDTA